MPQSIVLSTFVLIFIFQSIPHRDARLRKINEEPSAEAILFCVRSTVNATYIAETPYHEATNTQCNLNIHFYYEFQVKGLLSVTAKFESACNPGVYLGL